MDIYGPREVTMGYRVMGRAHAAWAAWRRERTDRAMLADRASLGQGTVEYVGLILLVAVVLAGVVAATRQTSIGSGQIGETIVKKLKTALDSVR